MSENMVDGALASLQTAATEKREEEAALVLRLTTVRGELRRIDKALAVLDPTVGEASGDFADKVERLLVEKPLTKAEISHQIGGPRSRATHALRVLEKRGRVNATGTMRGKSPEFALVEA